MVGIAICRELLPRSPALLVVAARRLSKAHEAVELLRNEFPDSATELSTASGDIFLRRDWQCETGNARAAVLGDAERRRLLINDVLLPLDDEILDTTLLQQLITGTAQGTRGIKADIVIDCINTASALSYQNLYAVADRASAAMAGGIEGAATGEAVEHLLASLYIPQLVRHIQILHEALRRAGSQAYLKIGTSGTGGMGFNIAYTHGEEKPSRMLLSKAAIAGAQTQLTFLMARTPGGPHIVKEIKPAALIAWRGIGRGPIGKEGEGFDLYDCPLEDAVGVGDPDNLVPQGEFGRTVGGKLEGVYINTGENGVMTAAEFATISALDQMEIVTPEEIAANVVAELSGGNSGHDIIAALDGSVMGPTYRGGSLRESALKKLYQLEEEFGESVAYEILGPPRLSKLLFEAYLLKRCFNRIEAVLQKMPEDLSAAAENLIDEDGELRQRILSIGLPILLSDGARLLRGPVIKSVDAYHGWVDLTSANMASWQERLTKIHADTLIQNQDDTSSHSNWRDLDAFNIGNIAAWIFTVEEQGQRLKG